MYTHIFLHRYTHACIHTYKHIHTHKAHVYLWQNCNANCNSPSYNQETSRQALISKDLPQTQSIEKWMVICPNHYESLNIDNITHMSNISWFSNLDIIKIAEKTSNGSFFTWSLIKYH